MEKFEILYNVCLDEINIRDIIEVICSNIKLSKHSIPKCAQMIKKNMKKNIEKLSRPPRNRDEMRILVIHLNKLCAKEIISSILNKNTKINKKVHVSKEKLRRDRDVYGDRRINISQRPDIQSKLEYDDDDDAFYSMKPNDIGISPSGNTGNYASPFEDNLITNIGMDDKTYFNNGSQRDESTEQRLKEMINERDFDIRQTQRPPTPDFTLDGSGEKIRREKMLRRMNEMNGMNGMNGANDMNEMNDIIDCHIPGGSRYSDIDDPYASILGAGAPNNSSPFMGAGNPLMPISSTANISNQLGMLNNNNYNMNGGNNTSAKSIQFNNDYERKLAERRMMDIETGQPQSNQYNSDVPDFMNNNQPNYMNNNQPNYMNNNQPNHMNNNQPNFGQPSFNQPMFGQPAFNQPAFNQPYNQSYNQPVFNQSYNQPYNPPSDNQPAWRV